ncbi:conserved hypothetical protein [Talaromyces stipitatus ATCC 10500]|uniref:CST complex subunit Ten1 n=1 Tax=Talaromyces stipitatus (strain ATCC 10500 / CBS 375.48 / QM 6759 / NRRL 1006) TaxID=441959 RepID=B8LUN8_TALSN|nr:uncharacterized protein TSTA_072850 [Talaromyces stipitatus ATCC 10500]EED23895.1 conserved hypothetical protein [Talaromyces stipitatus ATCC 10500]
MNGPIPTRLVFLHELSSLPPHTKVRFLGCVTRYDTVRGRLELEHNFPPLSRKDKKRSSSIASRRVSVDICHVLNTITGGQLQVGTWLNIFGYIRLEMQSKKDEDCHTPEDANGSQIYVEAVMISDAGALRVAEYEQSLADMQAINRRLGRDT